MCAINRTRRAERSAKGFPTTSSVSSKIKDPIKDAGIETADNNAEDEDDEEDEEVDVEDKVDRLGCAATGREGLDGDTAESDPRVRFVSCDAFVAEETPDFAKAARAFCLFSEIA